MQGTSKHLFEFDKNINYHFHNLLKHVFDEKCLNSYYGNDSY